MTFGPTFGSNPLSPSSLGGGRRLAAYSSGHLFAIGAVDVIAGLIALLWPGVTVLALALIFGIMLIAGGLLAITVASAARRSGSGSVGGLVIGIIAVVVGVICLFHPGVGIWAIALACAIWFLMTGIGDLSVAAASPTHRTMFGILGVLSIIAAVILFFEPGAAIATVALIADISFLVRGVGEIGLGFRMRSAAR